MDFKTIFISVLTSLIIVLKRFIQLIFTPYKTMRKISNETDYLQIVIIFIFIFIYFRFSDVVKYGKFSSIPLFSIFILQFMITCFFFYAFSCLFTKQIKFKPFVFTLTYFLLPTLLWFFSNSVLFLLLPPPRTSSFLGKGFSIFFITYSISLLIWKLILFYLAVRFSSRLSFFKIFYLILLYLSIIIPYSYILYSFKIFKIPFL